MSGHCQGSFAQEFFKHITLFYKIAGRFIEFATLAHTLWQRFEGWIKFQVSFAKEPYKNGTLSQKRPESLPSLQMLPFHSAKRRRE